MANKARDDFSAKIINTLGRRVAFKCSNPDCRNQTLGPQEIEDGTVIVGIAAHINAAAPGGKRYDPNQTSDQRSSQDNGIWLCEICAKLVDSDEKRFPANLLHKWKEEAEAIAMKEIGRPPASGNITHAHHGEEERPRSDVSSGVSHSGGPSGHTIFFEIKNDGTAASNVSVTLEADEVAPEKIDAPINLPAKGKSHLVGHDVTSSDFFKKELRNPRLVFRYASAEGVVFESSRGLTQAPRADKNFNLKENGSYTDKAHYLALGIESPSFNLHARDASGLALSFSVTIPIFLTNHSRDPINLRRITVNLALPEGYECHSFGHGFNQAESVPARQVVEKAAQFSASIIGYGKGNGNALLEENKKKLLVNLSSGGTVVLTIKTGFVSLNGVQILERSFDITADLISWIKK